MGAINTIRCHIDTKFFGLTALNNDNNRGDIKYDADLVFVAGLSGHAFNAWQAPSEGGKDDGPSENPMWARDYMPEDLAGEGFINSQGFSSVRVMTYGYSMDLQDSTSFSRMSDFSRGFFELIKRNRRHSDTSRPFVFVAHDMGGILIKHAMVEAALRGCTEERKIFNTTLGYIFLGVPNRGLDTSQLKTIVAGQPNVHLISDIAINSSFPQQLHSGFEGLYQNNTRVKQVSAYETKLTSTFVLMPDGSWQRNGPSVRMVSLDSTRNAHVVNCHAVVLISAFDQSSDFALRTYWLDGPTVHCKDSGLRLTLRCQCFCRSKRS